MIPSPHQATWHKPTRQEVIKNNFQSTTQKCFACDGFGYVHKQEFKIENGIKISIVEKEKDCLICKGLGYRIRNG